MSERSEPNPELPAASPGATPAGSAAAPASTVPSTPAAANPSPGAVGAGVNKTAAEKPADLAADKPKRRHRLWWFAAAGVFAVGLLWQWSELQQQLGQTQEQLARRLADTSAQLSDARSNVAAAREAQQAQTTRIAVLEARLGELHAQQESLEGLYQELARGRDAWLLSEVDQLVDLAAQQLQLAGNVPAALAALGNAEARLARSERPQFIALRKALARDLQRLRALPLIDVAGISLKLENAALAADQMTMAFEARVATPPAAGKGKPGKESREPREAPPAETPPWWRRALGEVFGELQAMIRIERLDKPDPAILAPHHTVFLRENLKLRLLGARLALLARDQGTFKGELRLAVQWIDRYFDARDRHVAAALETLRPLLAGDVAIDPPTLAETQNALRSAKLAESRAEGRTR